MMLISSLHAHCDARGIHIRVYVSAATLCDPIYDEMELVVCGFILACVLSGTAAVTEECSGVPV